MIKVTAQISLNEDEIHFSFIRSPGPGGQKVNKVATGVLLRFNVAGSLALPLEVRERLIKLLASKLTNEGELMIKATRYRTQERNKKDAFNRLLEIIKSGATVPKKRKKTKPTFGSQQKRLTKKKLQSRTKILRTNKLNYE